MLLPLFPSSTSSPAFRPLLALLPYLYLIPVINRTAILTLTLFYPTSSYVFTSLTSLRLYVLRLVSPTTSLLIPVIPLSRLYTLFRFLLAIVPFIPSYSLPLLPFIFFTLRYYILLLNLFLLYINLYLTL
jgi:hypothetical protein